MQPFLGMTPYLNAVMENVLDRLESSNGVPLGLVKTQSCWGLNSARQVVIQAWSTGGREKGAAGRSCVKTQSCMLGLQRGPPSCDPGLKKSEG